MEIEQKEATPTWFDLAPDRKLLDSSFEGYKLSLEPFAHYKLELNNELKLDTYNYVESQTEPSNNHKVFVYQHLKLFGLQNLLIVNQFNDSNVYYFDSTHRLVRVNYKQARSLNPTNFKLGNSSQLNRVNPTMRFIGVKLAVAFDGFNTLYVCSEAENDNWSILYTWPVGDELKSSVLRDAIMYENKLHVLLMSIQETNSKFETYVNWVTFEIKNTDTEWLFAYKRLRRLNCYNIVPEYVNLETNGQSVYMTGPSLCKFVFDSEKPINLEKTKPIKKVATSELMTVDKPEDEIEKFYSWNQTPDEVNLTVRLDRYGVKSKNDLVANIKFDSIELKTQDNRTILNEKFFSVIKVDESIWTLNTNTNSMEITLAKAKTNEAWPICLQGGDVYGEYKSEQMELGADQFTSENLAKGNDSKTLFGTLDQQLEECDGLVDDQTSGNVDSEEKFLMMRRLDGDTHEPTHQCYINDNRYLFDVRLNAYKNPALCLRHDVDGVLWQPHRISEPSPTNTIWLTHEHTFLAFGYVQASKQDTKYRSCSPDCSYVAIVDTLRHIYVYRQDTETQGSVLKNRKTGKVVAHVGKQYLITLDSDKECYGVYCSNDFMIVILSDVCYMFKMSSKMD